MTSFLLPPLFLSTFVLFLRRKAGVPRLFSFPLFPLLFFPLGVQAGIRERGALGGEFLFPPPFFLRFPVSFGVVFFFFLLIPQRKVSGKTCSGKEGLRILKLLFTCFFFSSIDSLVFPSTYFLTFFPSLAFRCRLRDVIIGTDRSCACAASFPFFFSLFFF